MNKEILIEMTTRITRAGYLDLEFLTDTVEEYRLKIDEIIDAVEENFWEEKVKDINYLIYMALTQVAEQFIEEHEELFEERSDEYTIYTNYLDSHIYFEDKEVQREFEKW